MLNETAERLKFGNDYREQQMIERQVANAVTRVILPRMNSEQRGMIVDSHRRMINAQAEHRGLVDDVVNDLVRRGY